MDGRSQVVAKSGPGQFPADGRSTNAIPSLVYHHRMSGLLQHDGGGETIGSGPNHCSVDHVVILVRMWSRGR